MHKIKKIPLFAAITFGFLVTSAIFLPQSTYAAPLSPKQRCEKRIKQINNRGKKLAKKSIVLKSRYKDAKKSWNNKATKSTQLAAKYNNEDRLKPQVDSLNATVKNFQSGVKDYGIPKKAYIAERNSQVKSYKNFKANCSTAKGQQSARDKIKSAPADTNTLKVKSNALSAAYQSKVRPGIIAMRDGRNALLDARKNLKEVEVASPSQIQASTAEGSEFASNTPEELEENSDDGFNENDLSQGSLDEDDPNEIDVTPPNSTVDG